MLASITDTWSSEQQQQQQPQHIQHPQQHHGTHLCRASHFTAGHISASACFGTSSPVSPPTGQPAIRTPPLHPDEGKKNTRDKAVSVAQGSNRLHGGQPLRKRCAAQETTLSSMWEGKPVRRLPLSEADAAHVLSGDGMAVSLQQQQQRRCTERQPHSAHASRCGSRSSMQSVMHDRIAAQRCPHNVVGCVKDACTLSSHENRMKPVCSTVGVVGGANEEETSVSGLLTGCTTHSMTHFSGTDMAQPPPQQQQGIATLPLREEGIDLPRVLTVCHSVPLSRRANVEKTVYAASTCTPANTAATNSTHSSTSSTTQTTKTKTKTATEETASPRYRSNKLQPRDEPREDERHNTSEPSAWSPALVPRRNADVCLLGHSVVRAEKGGMGVYVARARFVTMVPSYQKTVTAQ